LRLCVAASGWLCGKRLALFLAELLPALEAEGALRLEPLVRSQVLAMSAAIIDVASGWTECMGVPSKCQDDVFNALEAIRGRLPFVLLGLDSETGGEFLNGHLVQYRSCIASPSHARVPTGNDQAHVELCGYPHNSTYADSGIMPTSAELLSPFAGDGG
jgi:hypothetical protein